MIFLSSPLLSAFKRGAQRRLSSQKRRVSQTVAQTELLETRILLSASAYLDASPDVTPADAPANEYDTSAVQTDITALLPVSETEPPGTSGQNNTLSTAQFIGSFGTGPTEDAAADLSGNLSFDRDFYSFSGNAGDVIGASVTGSAGRLELYRSDGTLLIGSSQDLTFVHPSASPLPGGGANAALSYVLPQSGVYYLSVSQGSGAYTTQLRAFRPQLEQESPGTKQTIFLDFDGETINAQQLFGRGFTSATLSPLSTFLPGWGLNSTHLDAVIDSVIAEFERSFSTDIRANGNNGDFDVSGLDGQFDVEILNSRDHADPFGDPNVSRVIIGGARSQLGISTIGIAESIDVGNFDTTETGVVLLDLLSGPSFFGSSLNRFPIAGGSSIIDLIGVGVGNIAAHEAGHFSGAWHTFQFNSAPNIMDQGGNLPGLIGIGPDGVFGTADDIDVTFGTDVYVGNEGFAGLQDTRNAIAFGLATGTGGIVATSNDLYAAVGRGSSLNPGGLLLIDQNNGVGTLVGDPVTPGGMTGLAFDDDGMLFGSSIDGPGGNRVSQLVKVDPDTGALISSAPITINGTPISIGDLAIQPGTGVIYGVHSNSDATSIPGGIIYTIDRATGEATQVGNTFQNRNGGLAFTPDGRLLFLEFNQLHELDPADASILSTLNLPFGGHDGLAVRPSDGALFATRAGAGTLGDEIRIVDPVTGSSTLIGRTGTGNASDLAFRPVIVPAPEFTTPLEPVDPSGSLIHDGSVTSIIEVSGDADSYEILVDPGQTITLTLDSSANLQGQVELYDPNGVLIGSATSSSAGLDAVVQTAHTTVGGTYEIIVSGASGVGTYNLTLHLNSAVELESHDGAANSPTPSVLFATERLSDELKVIDVSTGTATTIGSLGINIEHNGLAYDANSNSLWMVELATDALYNVDMNTGAATLIGSNGVPNITGLAFDPNTNTLYGISGAVDALFTINTSTGAATSVGPLGGNFNANGAAFDPNTGTLYFTDVNFDSLYSVNTSTGQATLIGPNGVQNITGLAFDPVTSTLYGASGFTDSFYTIDTTSGAATFVGPLGADFINSGLAFKSGVALGDAAQDLEPGFVDLIGDGERAAVIGSLSAGAASSVFDEEQSQLGGIHFPNIITFDFTDVPAPAGDATLEVFAVADLGSTLEYIDLSADNGLFTTRFFDDFFTGDLVPTTDTATIPQAVLEQMAADGTISLSFTPNSFVNNFGSQELRARLIYDVAPEPGDSVDHYSFDLQAGQLATIVLSELGETGATGGSQFSESQTQNNNVFFPNVLNFDFADAPTPGGDATLTIDAIADLDFSLEYLTISAEGLFSEDVFVTGGLQQQPVSTTVTIPQAVLDQLAADGTVSLTVTPSSAVNNFGSSELTLTLEYPAASEAGSVNLEIIDSAGTVLATAETIGTNVDLAIENFQAPSDGTYYIAVSSAGTADYSVVVTRNATFELVSEQQNLVTEELLVNGSFESFLMFEGWTAIQTNPPFRPWTVTGAGAGGGFGMVQTQPQDGQRVAWNGFDGLGPMNFQLYQDVTIPADAVDATLSWQDRIQWNFTLGANATIPRTFEVQVRDTSTNAVLETLHSFSTDTQIVNPTGDSQWQSHSVDLSGYIGQSVRIFFNETVPQRSTGPGQVEIDAVSLSVSTPEAAETLVFDFEEFLPAPQLVSSLTATRGDLDITITHENGVLFDVEQRTGTLYQAAFGTNSVGVFNGLNGAVDPGAFIVDFSTPVDAVSVDMGDFGADAETLLLMAFSGPNGTGTLIAQDTGSLPGGGNAFSFDTLTVSGSGIQSIRMIGGSPNFPNSSFYDNISVTLPAPEVAVQNIDPTNQVLGFLGSSSGLAALSSDLITNGDFETGTFAGWSTSTTSSSSFSINDGSLNPLGPALPIAPINGSFDAVGIPSGPSTRSLSQTITVPVDVASATLSWSDRIQNFANRFEDPGQEFRVLLRSVTGQLISEVFSTNPGDTLIQTGPNLRSFDVTAALQAHAGEAIVVVFEEQDSLFWQNVTIDDVRLDVETGGVTQSGADDYEITLAAGETIQISTITPADGPGEFLNELDPMVELIDSNGNVVASDDNGASDGRNVFLTHTAGAAGTYTVRISGINSGGTYVLDVNRSPVVEDLQLSASTITENDSVTVTGSFSDRNFGRSHTVEINWGDGTTSLATVDQDANTFTATRTFLDDHPATGTPSDNFTIGVTVTDDQGLSGSAQTTLTVLNADPVVSDLATDGPIAENGVLTLTGTYSDIGTLDTHSVAVNWDDSNQPAASTFALGTVASLSVGDTFASSTDGAVLTITAVNLATNSASFKLQHQYLDDGPAPGNSTASDTSSISVKVTDDDTGVGTGSVDAVIRNVAPVVVSAATDATQATPGSEGVPVQLSGSFTDIGTLDVHTVTVDWGDGTVELVSVSEVSGSGTFSGSHAYVQGGIFTVTVTVADDDLGSHTVTTHAVVTGVGVNNGQLQIVGTNDRDVVTVNQQGNGAIRVHASFIDDNGGRTFNLDDVDSIVALLLDGDDQMTIAGNIDLPSLIDAGAGDDHVNGGAGPDVINGADGDDHLNGNGGNDILIGGLGVDFLNGGKDEDILIGGRFLSTGGSDDFFDTRDDLEDIRGLWAGPDSFAQRQANVLAAHPDFFSQIDGSQPGDKANGGQGSTWNL